MKQKSIYLAVFCICMFDYEFLCMSKVHLPTSKYGEGLPSNYLGKSTSQWASELEHWEEWFSGDNNKIGRWTVWKDRQPWSVWLLGESAKDTLLPLLQGDPQATNVLIELLHHPDPKNRRIGVQGLKNIGRSDSRILSILLSVAHDRHREVQMDAMDAIYYLNPDFAQEVGITRGRNYMAELNE